MQKLILTGLLFSFLLSACDGGRNIDMSDRERRLGLGGTENDPSGGGVDPDVRIQSLDISEAQILEADKKVIFKTTLVYSTKSEYRWHESLVVVDLQSKLLYLYGSEGLKTLGNVECTSPSPSECKTFSLKQTIHDFFPYVDVPSLQNQPFEVTAVSSAGDLELQKKINDTWTPAGSVSQIAFNTFHNFKTRTTSMPTKYYSFPSSVVPDKPSWFRIRRNSVEITIPFYDPLPGHRLMSVVDGKIESELSFIATYLNMADGQILTQQYRVENVQK